MLNYPLQAEIRISSSGGLGALRELTTLNVLRDGYVSIIFLALADFSAIFSGRLSAASRKDALFQGSVIRVSD
jgi:hypothetical protein